MTNPLEIQPFRIDIAPADLDDLRDRIGRTRWPAERSGGWSRGVPLDHLRALADYWAGGYDWRAEEAKLNAVPQYTTEFDGQTVHFVHVRSPEPDAVPLILNHGWPSSPVEFRDVIGPLTDPRAHGGRPEDAFHVVIPALPGYGFSTPGRDGWGNLFQVAMAWARLMDALGYDRYAVHGTDAGSGVAGMLGMVAGDKVIGIHLTGTTAAMPFGPPLELDGLSGTDLSRARKFNEFQADGLGYLHLQATRPQTLAYSLTDSPVGQLAWIVEKFHEWTDPTSDVDRDHLLTNVSVNWFTRAGASSAHATYEGMQAWKAIEAAEPADLPPGPPTAVAVFAADTTIRSVMDPQGQMARWTEYDRGGHFPAMEVPDLVVGDLREFFRSYR
jgi:pimeloyl-ACP methyl ester carboxylesterase